MIQTKMNPKIKIGLIGLGNWGINHLRTFSQIPECEIRWIVDLMEKNIKKCEKIVPDAKATTDYRFVTENNDVDAVVIATSANAHYIIAKSALENGKDVLVEKPMALKTTDAEDLVKIAKINNRILMVGHLLLYHPAVQKLKAYISDGELGDIYYIHSIRVNLGVVRRNENALWSFAPHDISIMLYLLNAVPTEVQAVGKCYLLENIYDLVFLTLNFPQNILGQAHVSWLDPHKIRKITIVGSKKMAVFDDMEPREKIKIYDKGVNPLNYESYGDALTLREGDVYIPYIKMSEPLRIEAYHFLDCVRTRKQPLTDGEQGLITVKILQGLQQSLDNGGIAIKL